MRSSESAAPSASADDQIYPTEPYTTYTLFRKTPRASRMVQDGFLWVEAEDFSDYGRWLLDTQFVQNMGSGYLIAAGVGRPIADASTRVEIPKDGQYRVWVRAKNWIKDAAPGRFTISVNGARSKQVFGAAPTEEWIWESAGEFALKAGPATLALNDLSGYFARCDALLLTTDLKYTPPREMEPLQRERARLAGVSLEPKDEGEFDVVVVGGGAAGACAAIAAARMNAKTALIQDRPVLGGNASDELGVGICGASVSHANARESGIIEEASRLRARYKSGHMSEGFRILAEQEPRLTVFYNRRAIGATMRDAGAIASVKAVDTLEGTASVFRGRYFIDCTGDGWVGYFAGAKFRLGRETREEFGEDLAPPKADTITMSGCIMGNYAISFRSRPAGHPINYVAPPWAAKLPPPEEFGRNIRRVEGGEWWLEHPGEIDDLWDPERARDELIKISFGYWDFIKNRWPDRERARDHALTFVPFMNAKRETRRLVGDYIMKQQDAQAGTMFPDRISYGGWSLDVHNPKGIFSGKEGPYYCDPRVPIYSIPYRCIYSVNVGNLFFAGRNVSVTHIALGSVRVQGTLATLGQAAGTAAALCLKRGIGPRELGQKQIGLLQQTLLKHDQYIPELKNEDPDDLARTATVTASSTAAGEEFGKEKIEHYDLHELAMPRAAMFPRGVHPEIQTVYALLKSSLSEPLSLTLHAREAAAPGDFSSTTDLVTATATVPANKQTWIKFDLKCRTDKPYIWVWLPEAKGVEWFLMRSVPPGWSRGYGGGVKRPWTTVQGQCYMVYTNPANTIEMDYRPANAINGVARVVGSTTNQWVSDPVQPMPQWLELAFARPAKMNTIYLTFDTDMNERFAMAPLPRACVRDYSVSYYDGANWREVASVKDNFQRHRVHRFDAVTAQKLRVTVSATNGDKSARIFEVRVYDEEPTAR
ncbi:MAG: FAD-dependent oxidoreductase [Candidatus Sumerlaeota bacterium]|nr:FAD-dependent oxidoreductase [Candidatus Sumerlaeota bacterium]